MKNFLYIAVFAVVVSLFYTAVGQVLPQLESRPPPEVKIGEATLTSDEVLEAGAGVFDANCAQCHKIGVTNRCPDLAGIGQRAKERAQERKSQTAKDFTDAEYLVEALCRPGDYLVEGFGNIMPPQGKVLDGGQMLAVVAYMQDLGGEVTVSLTDKGGAEALLAKFGCATTGAGGAQAAVAQLEPVGEPAKMFTTFGCSGCHHVDKPDKLIGPSLVDIGSRLDKAKLFEALLAPDLTIPEADPPYPPGMMKATLDGNGFYERMTPADYRALVDWLADLKG